MFRDGSFLLRDSDSTNGTYLNGKDIFGEGARDDILSLANIDTRVTDAEAGIISEASIILNGHLFDTTTTDPTATTSTSSTTTSSTTSTTSTSTTTTSSTTTTNHILKIFSSGSKSTKGVWNPVATQN